MLFVGQGKKQTKIFIYTQKCIDSLPKCSMPYKVPFYYFCSFFFNLSVFGEREREGGGWGGGRGNSWKVIKQTIKYIMFKNLKLFYKYNLSVVWYFTQNLDIPFHTFSKLAIVSMLGYIAVRNLKLTRCPNSTSHLHPAHFLQKSVPILC